MRAVLAPALLLPLAGCLDIAKQTYRFDLKAHAGTLESWDIRTDDAANAAADFAELVNDMVLGSKPEEDHPTWRLSDRHLEERDGVLVGTLAFAFDSPEDVGLYQFDRKSAYLWCAKDTESILDTNGEIIPAYPRCVAFSRKTKVFEVTVSTSSGTGGGRSLLPEFQAWDGGAVEAPAGATNDFMSALGALGAAMQQMTGDGGGVPDLSSLLPGAEAAPEWTALGLPLAGGTVVESTADRLTVSHQATPPEAAIAQYSDALVKAGFVAGTAESGATPFTKGDETLALSATAAGQATLVVVARR